MYIILCFAVILAYIDVIAAESLKFEGYLKYAQFLRVITVILAMAVLLIDKSHLELVISAGIAGVLSFVLYVKDTFTPQKVYTKYVEIPRQVIYREDPATGKCYVLTENQAKIANAHKDNVYIHAMVRVKYSSVVKKDKQ